jgi:hypothetical protein
MAQLRKHGLRVPGTTEMTLPEGTEFLRVGFQDAQLFLWTLEPTSAQARQVRWTFCVYETGAHVTPELDLQFAGTALGEWRGRPYVAHVFRSKPRVLDA